MLSFVWGWFFAALKVTFWLAQAIPVTFEGELFPVFLAGGGFVCVCVSFY